jgi:hypothetical protein
LVRDRATGFFYGILLPFRVELWIMYLAFLRFALNL